jgi:hypothetical protein
LLAAWVLFNTVERYTLGAQPVPGSGAATAILFPDVTLPRWRPLQHPGLRTMMRGSAWRGRPFR